MHRRRFLATLAANLASVRAASALAGLGGCSSAGQSSAGSIGRQRLERVGLQLYTVRHALAKDFDGTLARVAATGYREVEFAGYVGRRPEEVSAALERHGLRAPAAHVALEALRENWRGTVDAAHVIDHDFLVVAWLPLRERRTIADYERLAETFNRLGKAARAADLGFAYHNYEYDFVPLAGRVPYDVLLTGTDPDTVAFEMDLYWITKGGADPITYFDRHPGRFPMVHVKDSAGAPDHRMVDVGAGTIDFRRIFARREDAGIEHAFVEHDEPADALASIKASYDYLTRLTF
jgi:sugar phosphate isomerase/epimerase